MLNIDTFMEALPIAGAGMLGVFIVITAIFLAVKILCRLLKDKEEK